MATIGLIALTLCTILGISIAAEKTAEEWIKEGDALQEQGSTLYDQSNSDAGNSKMNEALQAYENAIELDSQSEKAWVGKGDVLGYLEKYDDARIAYEKVLEINSKNWWAAFEIGANLDVQADYMSPSDARYNNLRNEAIQAYDRAIMIDPSRVDAWDMKILDLQDLGRNAEANEVQAEMDRYCSTSKCS